MSESRPASLGRIGVTDGTIVPEEVRSAKASEEPTQNQRAAVLVLTLLVGLLTLVGSVGLQGALRSEGRVIVARLFGGSAIVGLLLIITVLGTLVIGTAKTFPARRSWLAAFGCGLALAVAGVELRQTYPVGTPHAFPHAFAATHLQNFNLTESLITGQNLLKGAGNTLPVAGGSTKIDTYRMPGYGLFVALAGTIFRAPVGDLESLGASTVYLQVLSFACAVAFLAYNLPRSMSMGTAALLTAAVCWFPQAFDLTQADSMILACGLLIAGAACLFDRDLDVSTISWRYHLLLHAAFGLYFVMRSDVLVGWMGVSLFLYRRRRKWLVLPVALVLAIGCSWGLYKKLHGSDFVMTTSNLGHVAFVGLWQTPQHKFIWEPTDESYLQWISAHGYTYMEPRANGFAMREVVRFWVTYPGYIAANAANKAFAYVVANVWTGSLALPPSEWIGKMMRRFVYWLFLGAIAGAVVTGFERRRTFLLAWPLLFNLPLFLLLQYNPRYVPFVTCSIMFAAVPLLVSRDFYRRMARVRGPLVVALIVLLCAVRLSGPAIYRFVLSDRFRYWTPLIDPGSSTLNVLR